MNEENNIAQADGPETCPPRGGKKLRYIALGMALGLVLCGIAVALFAALSHTPPAAPDPPTTRYDDIHIYVNGRQIMPIGANSGVAVLVSEGTAYLSIDVVGEVLGERVEWDGAAGAVYIGVKPPYAFIDKTKKTIYVIVRVISNVQWTVVEDGARKASEDLGCNVIFVGTGPYDVERQIALLQDVIDAGADAIVIDPLDRKALAGPISEAFKSGIPVILYESLVDTEDYSAAYLTDNYEAGAVAAEALLAKLRAAKTPEDREGVIAVTIGSAGSTAIRDRLAGFKDHWDENAPEAWTVLWDEMKVNEGDVSKALAFGQEFIDETPNLIGLFAPNNGSTVGFVKALRESGRTDIAMVGFDYSAEVYDIIYHPDFHVATIVQRQYYMGYDGVAKALALANGGTVTQKRVNTGVLVIDHENIDLKEVREITDR